MATNEYCEILVNDNYFNDFTATNSSFANFTLFYHQSCTDESVNDVTIVIINFNQIETMVDLVKILSAYS